MLKRRSGAYIAGRKRSEEAVIYLKTKDILSRPRLFNEGIPKRAGDAGDVELTVLDIDHIIA